MRYPHGISWALMFCLVALPGYGFGQAVWYVDSSVYPDVGTGTQDDPFGLIGSALSAADDGDTVLVADGVYIRDRDLDFFGKAITVRSANGAANCVIDCANRGRGFVFHSQEPPAATLIGFTIVNAVGEHGGAGIAVTGGSEPTIQSCRISMCSGDGIYCEGSSPIIASCEITDCDSATGGGIKCVAGSDAQIWMCRIANCLGSGVYAKDSSPVISRCEISDNTAEYGGGVYGYGGHPVVLRCEITRNRAKRVLPAAAASNRSWRHGGGIYCREGSMSVSNSLITWNTAYAGGGAAYAHAADLLLDHCTIVANQSGVGSGDCQLTGRGCIVWDNGRSDQIEGDADFTYSCIQRGYAGEGNIDADPLLTSDRRHLMAGSPCIDAGDPEYAGPGMTDYDGDLRRFGDCIDIGLDEFVDGDGDALPDWWEQRFFGSATGADPDGDSDGDGRLNIDEYRFAANPNVAPKLYHVATSGDDDWDGLAAEWDGAHGPKASIQAGVDAADAYEGDSIVVADGVYTGPGNRDIAFDGKRICVRSAGGPDACIIDCEGSARGFTCDRKEPAGSVIEGFTVRDGHAIDCGAGVYLHDTTIAIRNCRIVDCGEPWGAAGGIYAYRARLSLVGCRVAHCLTRDVGGGLECVNCDLNMADCVFEYNEASGSGGGVSCDGGDATIQGCTFAYNSADFGGGLSFSTGEAVVEDCRFARNVATQGGAVHVGLQADMRVGHSTFVGNRADLFGAALHSNSAHADLTACRIVGNRAAQWGGGISTDRSTLRLSGCTMAENWAVFGSTLGCYSSYPGESEVEFYGCNLSDVHEPVWQDDGTTILATYSNFRGASGASWFGDGCIDVDPMFVSPGYFEDDVWVDGDYRLSAGSPCVDAGDPDYVPEGWATDLDGHARVLCGRMDVGAYESGIGDVDCSGVVDLVDFASWEDCRTSPRGGALEEPQYASGCEALDFDFDGDVDLADFVLFQRVDLGL